MRVRVYGIPAHIDRAEIKEATRWFGEMLMGPRLIKSLDIKILNREHFFKTAKAWAVVDGSDPRTFTIIMDYHRSRRAYLKTLAHELVHVKQYARNELGIVTIGGKTRWQGYKINDVDVHYFDQPWEIEAYGREIGLFHRYKEHLRKQQED